MILGFGGDKNKQQPADPNKPGNGNNGTPDGSNATDNLNPFAKPADNTGTPGGQPPNGTQQPPPRNPQEDAARMRNFYKENGLYDGIKTKELMEAFANNDSEAVQTILEGMAEGMARAALAGADKLTTARIDRATRGLDDKATQSAIVQLTRRDMYEQLPFTKDPAMQPIADQVLDGFIKQGKEGPEALEAVRQYFEKTVNAAGKHLGYNVSKRGAQPSSGDFRGARAPDNNDNDGGGDQDDWTSILSGGNTQA